MATGKGELCWIPAWGKKGCARILKILHLDRVTFADVFAELEIQTIKLDYHIHYHLPCAFMAHLGPGAHDLDASLVVHIK